MLQNGLPYYPSGVADLFPNDVWLQEEGIESYLAIPLYGTDGNPVGYLGVAIVSLDFYFQPVNDTLCRMLGYTSKEMIALTWIDKR